MKTTANTFKGTACKKCGGVIRYIINGKCVACHAKRNEARKPGKGAKALIERALKFDCAVVEPVEQQDWQIYATKINEVWRDTWQKAVPGVLETGKLLIEAKERVSYGAWELLKAKLPFSANTAEQLMKIARNAVISNPAYVQDLPPSWGTLYELTKLPEPLLIEKIENHTISAKTERKEVVKLLGPAPKPKKKRDGKPKYQDDGTYEAQVEEIEGLKAYNAKLLEAVKEIDGIVIKPDDDLEAVATKVVGVIGNGNVALLIEELRKHLPAEEAA